MRPTAFLLILLIAACARGLPDAQDTNSQAALKAPYPSLVPIDGLLAKSEAGTQIIRDTATLEARVARLKRKAAALKGRTVVEGATRLKLLDAANRNAARTPG